MGCRSSEASALQWRNISEDCRQITFEQAVILTENGRRIRKGLETQSSRKFPCNDSLEDLLLSIRSESPRAEDLVFPSPTGKPVDLNNFRQWLHGDWQNEPQSQNKGHGEEHSC
ncbi:MAG: hypothetical protein AAFZ17_16590 [Cyanobacteria bacterium J06650_10]